MAKILSLNYESSLTDLRKINSSFDIGVLRICYTGENRNNTYFSREALEKNIKTIYNCPIVCNYSREDDSLGGHDISVVEDKHGCLKIVNLTQPVGVIPESAKIWFEDYEEADGTIHEYLYSEVLLWKRQEAYEKIKHNGITAHSMEVNVKNGKVVDGVFHIEDFEFTAFALIGIEPCFESSALEVYSSETFKDEYLMMIQEVKNTFSSKEAFNIETKESGEKGGSEMSEKEKEKLSEEEELIEEDEKKDEEFKEDEDVEKDVTKDDAAENDTKDDSEVEKEEGASKDTEEKEDEDILLNSAEEDEDLKQQLADALAKIETLEKEVEELTLYKEEIEKVKADEAREEIWDEFMDLKDKEEFINLRNKAIDFDLETLKEKCFAIRGKYATVNVKFSHDNKSPKLPVDFRNSNKEEDLPYNGIVEKYAKN